MGPDSRHRIRIGAVRAFVIGSDDEARPHYAQLADRRRPEHLVQPVRPRLPQPQGVPHTVSQAGRHRLDSGSRIRNQRG